MSVLDMVSIVVPIIIGIPVTYFLIKIIKTHLLGFPIICEIIYYRQGNITKTRFDSAKLIEKRSGLSTYRVKGLGKNIIVSTEGRQLSVSTRGKDILRLYSPAPNDYRIMKIEEEKLVPINEKAKAAAFAAMKEELLKYRDQGFLERYGMYLALAFVAIGMGVALYMVSGNIVDISAQMVEFLSKAVYITEHQAIISENLAQILGQADITITTTTIPY